MKRFQQFVYRYYAAHGRNLPWRKTRDPYRILVSELMLQQTQVSRVLKKYRQFIRRFPTVRALSKATLRDVMEVWQGLGYNRRALALKHLAEKIVSEYAGKIPSEREILKTLPGIGEATSGAVCAFAFNKPVVFIETNIRSVFIYHFFKDKEAVSDSDLIPFIEKTLDKNNPRTWYYALMDYGVYLKNNVVNPNRSSIHYRKQTPFVGSNRQIRGALLKLLTKEKRMGQHRLYHIFKFDIVRTKEAVASLQKEGLLKKNGKILSI